MLMLMITGFITVIVGLTLMPVVANSVQLSLQNGTGGTGAGANVTGASATIAGLITLFFALAVVAVGVAIVSTALRQAGAV